MLGSLWSLGVRLLTREIKIVTLRGSKVSKFRQIFDQFVEIGKFNINSQTRLIVLDQFFQIIAS